MTPGIVSTSSNAAVPSLTEAELARLRVQLEDCRRERREQLDALGVAPPNEDPVAAAHRESVRSILADSQAAFDRLAVGTYGTCTYCAAPIPVARLELVPYAAGCVTCQRQRAAG